MVGDVVHICNRGFNKEKIFLEETDFERFVESLYKLNNKSGTLRFRGKDIFSALPDQDRLVDILQWSLQSNHYHLLLHEKVDVGIVEFVKRLGKSYTK